MYVSIFNHPILNDLIDSVFKVVDFNSTKMEIYIFFFETAQKLGLSNYTVAKKWDIGQVTNDHHYKQQQQNNEKERNWCHGIFWYFSCQKDMLVIN